MVRRVYLAKRNRMVLSTKKNASIVTRCTCVRRERVQRGAAASGHDRSTVIKRRNRELRVTVSTMYSLRSRDRTEEKKGRQNGRKEQRNSRHRGQTLESARAIYSRDQCRFSAWEMAKNARNGRPGMPGVDIQLIEYRFKGSTLAISPSDGSRLLSSPGGNQASEVAPKFPAEQINSE